jgi:mRNA interferase MazF
MSWGHEEYYKDFDGWNESQKKIHARVDTDSLFFKEREVWWCSVGVNIGREIDGKNEHFERPVLVVRKINSEQFLGVPLTSKHKRGRHYVHVQYGEVTNVGMACLSQVRAFSAKRLLRKIGRTNHEDFLALKLQFINFFSWEVPNKSDPAGDTESSEPEGLSSLIVPQIDDTSMDDLGISQQVSLDNLTNRNIMAVLEGNTIIYEKRRDLPKVAEDRRKRSFVRL